MKIWKICIFFLITTQWCQAQFYNKEVASEIGVESKGELIALKGLISNKTQINTSIRYKFSVIFPSDQDASSVDKEETEGRLVIAPGEKLEVLSKSIPAIEDQKIIILFLVYDLDDKLIGKDRKVMLGGEIIEEDLNVRVVRAPNNTDVSTSKGDGIVLKGIVIEDTKTKPGSDFYKAYYSNYLSKNINGSSIVTIKEVLALGRNTKIEVLVADTKVFEFFVRPSSEYLNQMAAISLNQTVRQLDLNFKNQNTVQRY